MQLEKLISLGEVKMEGIAATPHNIFVQREMGRRKEAMKYIKDASGLAKYLDGTVEPLQREDGWMIKKEFFQELKSILYIDTTVRKEALFKLSIMGIKS